MSRRLLLPLSLLLLLAGCLGPAFELEELSSESLAFVYRTRDESEHRKEFLSRAREQPRLGRPGEHHFRLEDVGDLLGLGRTKEEKRADLLGRMALLDARTGEVDLLRFAPRGARPLAWSPDRSSLLYLAPMGGELHKVFAWDRESGEVRPIARGAYQYLGASYGPDGRLALARLDPREGDRARSRIFVTGPGGGRASPLTEGPADAWPVWSPDGSILVYSSVDESGRGVILAIDPIEGGEPKRIALGMEPAFFPDGEWVVYCAKRRGRWAIWRVRPDGSGRHPIGSSSRDERDPTVSPDGRFIVYVAEQDEYQRLMVRPVDGSGDRLLLTEGDGLIPVW